MYELFNYISDNNLQNNVKVHISYSEFKNEKFTDLLTGLDTPLELYENSLNFVKLIGLSKVRCVNLNEGLRSLK